jgi:hydrogenase expression/formation protein HypD
MKYIDEYRDPVLARRLLAAIETLARRIAHPVTIMEVCGSHTYAIGRFGIRKLLPESIRLVSGPGCPVCVTSIQDVDRAIYLAGIESVIFATFGDMLRVPGTRGASLQKARAAGADIRIVSSAMDCIPLVEKSGGRAVVMMGIGFETTTPTIAATVKMALKKGLENFCVFSVHKVVPPAIRVLLDDPALNIDGFICPGHVSTIIGADAYRPITEAGRAAVITGFEPVDILEGIRMILGQIAEGKREVAIQYARGVRREGNPSARAVMDEVFAPEAAVWRGLGEIPGSGLQFREAYRTFDALRRFTIPPMESLEPKGCECGSILKGVLSPQDCPLFNKACTPMNPIGPCMVSSEGTCAAYYKYH